MDWNKSQKIDISNINIPAITKGGVAPQFHSKMDDAIELSKDQNEYLKDISDKYSEILKQSEVQSKENKNIKVLTIWSVAIMALTLIASIAVPIVLYLIGNRKSI